MMRRKIDGSLKAKIALEALRKQAVSRKSAAQDAARGLAVAKLADHGRDPETLNTEPYRGTILGKRAPSPVPFRGRPPSQHDCRGLHRHALSCPAGRCRTSECQTMPIPRIASTHRPAIVGTWELVSNSWSFPDGRVLEPWGKAAGRISYDADGNMMAVLMHEQRNRADGSSRSDQQTADSYSAYFGTYRADLTQGIIRHQVTGSLNGNNASGELLRSFKFEDGFEAAGRRPGYEATCLEAIV
jgi:hypothetical protein